MAFFRHLGLNILDFSVWPTLTAIEPVTSWMNVLFPAPVQPMTAMRQDGNVLMLDNATISII
jgi:hypothetical protein